MDGVGWEAGGVIWLHLFLSIFLLPVAALFLSLVLSSLLSSSICSSLLQDWRREKLVAVARVGLKMVIWDGGRVRCG